MKIVYLLVGVTIIFCVVFLLVIRVNKENNNQLSADDYQSIQEQDKLSQKANAENAILNTASQTLVNEKNVEVLYPETINTYSLANKKSNQKCFPEGLCVTCETALYQSIKEGSLLDQKSIKICNYTGDDTELVKKSFNIQRRDVGIKGVSNLQNPWDEFYWFAEPFRQVFIKPELSISDEDRNKYNISSSNSFYWITGHELENDLVKYYFTKYPPAIPTVSLELRDLFPGNIGEKYILKESSVEFDTRCPGLLISNQLLESTPGVNSGMLCEFYSKAVYFETDSKAHVDVYLTKINSPDLLKKLSTTNKESQLINTWSFAVNNGQDNFNSITFQGMTGITSTIMDFNKGNDVVDYFLEKYPAK